MACTVTWGHGGIQAQAAAEAMSESMALLKLGSMLISKAPVIVKGHANAQGGGPSPGARLVCEEHPAAWAILIWGACAATRGHGDMSMSIAHGATKSHKDAWLLGHHLCPCCDQRNMYLFGPC